MERVEISKYKQTMDEPRGYSHKYWLYDNHSYLVKYNGPTCPDSDVMESISAEILKKLNIKNVEVLLAYNNNKEHLKQMQVDDPKCCIIRSFLTNPAEVTISLLNDKWTKVNTNDEQKNISSCFYKMFSMFDNLMAIKPEDSNQMKKDYVRMIFGDCIIDNEDRRLKNVEAIFNERTLNYHLAPSFDNALAFNAFNIGSDEGYCYIGNQEFPANSIITYITNHYLEDVDDIIQNLDYLCTNQLETIIKNYQDEIPQDKLVYIYNYVTNTNGLIQEKTNKKTLK